MTISFQVLGTPGRDNAVLVKVDSGHSLERLLFDCGDACLTQLPFSEVQAIDQQFFSHLHMDHIGGFDHYFRANYDRTTKPNRSWGPPGTAAILQHRFQGYLWNLHDEMSGSWQVTEIHPSELCTSRFELSEAYSQSHEVSREPFQWTVLDQPNYRVEALTLDHRTPSIAYIIREPSKQNIDIAKMAELGLKPGPWLKQLKESVVPVGEVEVGGTRRSLQEIRNLLVVESPGDSFAYLTDFLLPAEEMLPVAERLRGCRVLVCDGQYRHADLDLARKNYHMTTVLSAQLAAQSEVGELVLFHLSDRYEPVEWDEMLAEARHVFPNTRFPVEWKW